VELIAGTAVGCRDIFDVAIVSQTPFTIKFDQLDKKGGVARMNGNNGTTSVRYINEPPRPSRNSQVQFIEQIQTGAMSVTSVFPMKYGDGYRYVAVFNKITTIVPFLSTEQSPMHTWKAEQTYVQTWIGSAKLNPSKSPKSREEILAGLRSKDTPEAMFQLGLFLADKGADHRELYLTLWKRAAEKGHIPAGYLWERQTTNSNGNWTKEFLHLVVNEDPKALAVASWDSLKGMLVGDVLAKKPALLSQAFPAPTNSAKESLRRAQSFNSSLAQLEKAMQKHEPLAQLTLGMLLATGNISKQDKVEARRLLEQVASQDGDSYSQMKAIEMLGPLCASLGDSASALTWQERSLAKDNPLLAYYIGRAYVKMEVHDDNCKALDYFKIAAEAGDARSQYWMGVMHSGLCIEQLDYKEMMRWYKTSAENGYLSAITQLGFCYRAGYDGDTNIVKALQFFRVAAEKGDRVAQYELGTHFCDGVGVIQNPTEAVQWFTKAAMQGDPRAMFKLGLACANGDGIQRDLVRASALWNLAAARGEETSRHNRKIVEDQLNDAQRQRASQLAIEIENRINSQEVPIGALDAVSLATMVTLRPISLTPHRSFTGLLDVSLTLELINKTELPLSLVELAVFVQSGATTIKDTYLLNLTTPVEPAETRQIECTFGSDSQLAKAQLYPNSKVTLQVQRIFTPKR